MQACPLSEADDDVGEVDGLQIGLVDQDEVETGLRCQVRRREIPEISAVPEYVPTRVTSALSPTSISRWVRRGSP